jgi:hypothetical protein
VRECHTVPMTVAIREKSGYSHRDMDNG